MSKVSVIIPVLNSENTIVQTLESVQKQSFNDLEIILVDNGSKDNSNKIVSDFQDDRLKLYTEKRKGACAARNLGIQKASGKYIQFLDADDVLSKDKIKLQFEMLEQAPDNSVCFCNWEHFVNLPGDSPKKISPFWKGSHTGIDLLLNLWNSDEMMQTACWLTPMNLIQKSGFWDETLTKNQDGEFFCRVLLNTRKALFDEKSICYYRKPGHTNVSQQTGFKAAESLLKSFKSYESHCLKIEDTPRVHKVLAKHYLQFIYQYYPNYPKMLKICWEKFKKLDVEPEIYSIGGNRFRIFVKWAGFKNALRFRRLLSLFKIRRNTVH